MMTAADRNNPSPTAASLTSSSCHSLTMHSLTTTSRSETPNSVVDHTANENSDSHKRKAAEAYAIAATAARLKRKRVLVRRSQTPKSKLRKPNELTVSSDSGREATLDAPLVIQPTVAGVQEIAGRLLGAQSVSVPTECTYEVLLHLQGEEPKWTQNRLTAGLNVGRPHLYVPSTLDPLPLVLKRLLPSRCYAAKAKRQSLSHDTTVVIDDVKVQCNLNETVLVLQRLAAKLWPGPAVMYIAVPTASDLTVRRKHCASPFLALRSPSHPLTVKVIKEYRNRIQATAQQPVDGTPLSPERRKSSSSNTPSANMGTPIRLQPEIDFELHTPHPTPAVAGNKTVLKSPLAGTKVCTGTTSGPAETESLLVGMPLLRHHATNHNAACIHGTRYVIEAAQATCGMPVILDGHRKTEWLHVPPCEHGAPWEWTLWLDATSRTVTLVHPAKPTSKTPPLTPKAVWQMLQMQSAKTGQEKICQALLLKWKVVEETE